MTAPLLGAGRFEMPKLKNIEDLKTFRKEAERRMRVRLEVGTRITVGMGSCGIAAGARETMRAVLAELEKRDIDAHVTIMGCVGVCASEPLVEIEQTGSGRATYGGIKPDMVPRLIEEHLINRHVIQEWVAGCYLTEAGA